MSHSFYNFGMATTETPAQIKANYVRLMGPQAGEAFAELMQDVARLHLKWNEFLALFAVSPAQIETLNRAAPGFFYLVSEAWWDSIILYIFRLTDHNKKVLSLVTLKKLLPPAIQGGYDQELKLALAASRFAHDLRHADIGHRNKEVALRVKPVPAGTRSGRPSPLSTTPFTSSIITTPATSRRSTTILRFEAALARFCGWSGAASPPGTTTSRTTGRRCSSLISPFSPVAPRALSHD